MHLQILWGVYVYVWLIRLIFQITHEIIRNTTFCKSNKTAIEHVTSKKKKKKKVYLAMEWVNWMWSQHVKPLLLIMFVGYFCIYAHITCTLNHRILSPKQNKSSVNKSHSEYFQTLITFCTNVHTSC